MKEHKVVMKMLMSRDDININSKNRKKDTLLFLIASREHKVVIKMLINRDDVDMNSKNLKRNTLFFTII